MNNANRNLDLIAAVVKGDLETVKSIVMSGVDPITGDNQALWCAMDHGHLDIVKYLFSVGADEHTVFQNERDLLSMSIRRGHIELSKFLVTSIAVEVDSIHVACCAVYNQLDTMKLLISWGAEIDRNVVKCAMGRFRVETIKYLLSLGVPMVHATVRNYRNKAFKRAVDSGDLDAMKFLISMGVLNSSRELIQDPERFVKLW